MKIVYINETCGIGSIGRLTLELASQLEEAGDQAYIMYSNGTSRYKHSIKVCNRVSQCFHALFSRLTGLQGYFSHLETYNILKKLQEIKPDVVHLQNLHSNYVNLKMLLSYLAQNDIPTVLTLHDCWFFTGKCTSFVPASCPKYQSNCGNCPLLHEDNVNPTWFFDRTRKCHRDKKKWLTEIPRLTAVGVSEWITNEAKKTFLIRKNIRCIYNFIDTEVFQYRESNLKEHYGLLNKKIVIMTATELTVNKGSKEMIYLAENLPDDYKIIFVGGNKLKVEIPPNILHIRHTNNPVELAQLYSMADVCVNTTLYETFGMVTVESMACGTPVIVYRNTASAELAISGCGIALEQDKGYKEIVDTIRRVVEEPMTLKLYTREKRIRIIQQLFGKKEKIEEYMRLYREISAY